MRPSPWTWRRMMADDVLEGDGLRLGRNWAMMGKHEATLRRRMKKQHLLLSECIGVELLFHCMFSYKSRMTELGPSRTGAFCRHLGGTPQSPTQPRISTSPPLLSSHPSPSSQLLCPVGLRRLSYPAPGWSCLPPAIFFQGMTAPCCFALLRSQPPVMVAVKVLALLGLAVLAAQASAFLHQTGEHITTL